MGWIRCGIYQISLASSVLVLVVYNEGNLALKILVQQFVRAASFDEHLGGLAAFTASYILHD